MRLLWALRSALFVLWLVITSLGVCMGAPWCQSQ